METILNTPWLFTNAKTALSFLFIITLKSAVIILVAYVLTRSLRRAAAATRHLIWTMALVSILLLPIFSLLLPACSCHPGTCLFQIIFSPLAE